jgi:hypothetical protein
MEKIEAEKQSNSLLALKYWILMFIIWMFFVFEVWFIVFIIQKWGDPYYLSSDSILSSRLGEMIAFALCVVMVLYTIFASLVVIGHLVNNKLKDPQYRALIRMHCLVLCAYVIHWIIYLVIFFRP